MLFLTYTHKSLRTFCYARHIFWKKYVCAMYVQNKFKIKAKLERIAWTVTYFKV